MAFCMMYSAYELYKVKVKISQLCPTIWGLMYYTVHEILQARRLKWVAFPFSRGSSQPKDHTQFSHIAGRCFNIWATREAKENLGRKAVTNLDRVLKSRDITLLTKVHIVKAVVFPVVMYRCEKSESHSVMCNSLQPHGLYSPWNSPGQSTGVSSLSLLQGIFPTQGLNPGLLHCRQML